VTPRPRALVLAAGLGTRLRPLTDATPKPLLPVLGRPLLAWTLERLAAAGCEAVAINLHHHGGLLRAHFGGQHAGMALTWSEEPVLLGTLGALAPLGDFFAGAGAVLIVNGDSLCRWPLAELLSRHRQRGAAATLLLASRPDPADFGGGVAVGRDGAVRSLLPAASDGAPDASGAWTARRVFAGAHVLSPELAAEAVARARRAVRGLAGAMAAEAAPAGAKAPLSAPPPPPDIVRDLYEPLLAERPGCIASLTTARRWHDLGTPSRFLAATLDCLASTGRRRWVSPDAAVSRQATVRRASIEAGCRVDAGALVEDSVLLAGAAIGAGAEVRASLVGPGAAVAAGGRSHGQLVTAAGCRPLTPGDRG
jgi:mannose-1-phosphate guanylyltransferase